MQRFIKKTQKYFIQRLDMPATIQTLEGQVTAGASDFVVHGLVGELWPVNLLALSEKYVAMSGSVFGQTGFYESLPEEVSAYQAEISSSILLKQFNSSLQANPGDWLVTNNQGSTWVVRQDIFKLTYDPIKTAHKH